MLRRREFCFRQKGGQKVGKTKRGKGTKWLLLTDKSGIPLGALLDSASPAEVRLAEKLSPVVRGTPLRVVADRGYDSNRFRLFLSAHGSEPIIPARENNRNATHQDGRKLRRYRHRWIVERTFAWLGWFRCLVVRWVRKFENYLALFHLACAMISLKRVLG
jgi:transposase